MMVRPPVVSDFHKSLHFHLHVQGHPGMSHKARGTGQGKNQQPNEAREDFNMIAAKASSQSYAPV